MMRQKFKVKASDFLGADLTLGSVAVADSTAHADTPMTAGVVYDRMDAGEFTAYVTGVIEGLAYAQYESGGVEAMNCVYDWFFRGENSQRQIDQAFVRFADHYPGAVMAALVRRECGD